MARGYCVSLVLKRASASRLSGEWNDDDYDVLADGVVVGRIFNANAAPVGAPWMWSLAFGHHEDRTPTHGYRLARLVVNYGAEILLDDLLVRLSADCPWRDEPRGTCGVRFTDMPPRRPPDPPAALMRLRVVKGGKE